MRILAVALLTLSFSSFAKDPAHENCVDSSHEHEKLSNVVTQVAAKSIDEIYESMKAEFQSSAFCDPEKVISDPADRPSPFIVDLMVKQIYVLDSLYPNIKEYEPFLQRVAKQFKLSEKTVLESREHLSKITKNGPFEARKDALYRVKATLMKDLLSKTNAELGMGKEIKEMLAEKNIFKTSPEGEIECPFVTKDAFVKAMAGREKVLKSQKGIKLPDQITIVDYTRPSNERRMFVIDLKSNKVMHNTWVAHGGGNGQAFGKDKLGGSPEMSNEPGSDQSSDGFIIATAKSSGPKHGANVLLQGIDSNNYNIASRGVVIHAHETPMQRYNKGYVPKFGKPHDFVSPMLNVDPKTSSTNDLMNAYLSLSNTLVVGKSLWNTEGCLGVASINVKHLDRKGRDKTQLELLRDDLPGSIIFNYSGPDMKSKFF